MTLCPAQPWYTRHQRSCALLRGNSVESASKTPSLGLIFILGTLAAYGPLSTDLYMPALPTIAQEFQSPQAHQTMAVYFLGLALGQLFYGPLSDRVGRRRPLLVGSGLFALASLGCALAPSMPLLVFFRFLQALGGSVGMVTTLAIVRDLFRGRQAAQVISYLTLVMGVAPILAPLVGGQVLLYFDWRAIFVLLALFGFLCLGLVGLALPETHPPARRTQSPFWAALGDYLRLVRERAFLAYALPNSLMGAGFFTYLSAASPVFIGVYGVSPQHFGFIFGLNALGLILSSQLNALLLRRRSSRRILVGAMVLMVGAALGLVLVAASGAGGMLGVWAALFVCVGGMGLVRPNAQALAMEPYPERAGLASSLLGAMGSGTGALAGSLLGLFPEASALPMALIIAACYGLALGFFWMFQVLLRTSQNLLRS